MSDAVRGDGAASGDREVVRWLGGGRAEAALSDDGIWLRRGRRQVDLIWRDVHQVQVVARPSGRTLIEVFPVRGASTVVGPFAAPEAAAWVEAAAARASAAAQSVVALIGVRGFEVVPDAAD